MAYALDTIEITQDNQEWAERLGMDPAFEELLYASGGLKGDVHFNVLYSTDGPRSDPTIRGYLATFSSENGKESISLYKPVNSEEGEDAISAGDIESIRVGKNKAAFYGTSHETVPMNVMELNAPKVYTATKEQGVEDRLLDLLYKPIEGEQSLGGVMSGMGASDRYMESLSTFFETDRNTKVYAYEQEELGFFQKLGHYIDILKKDDEYRTLQISEVIGEGAEGMLNGLVTGLIFSQGAIYGLAGAMGIMSKFVPKVTMSLVAPIWGSKVDEARQKENSLEELRAVERVREVGFSCANGTFKVLMQPEVIKPLSKVVPAAGALGTIFAAEQLTLAIKDAGSPKTQVAIREELIQNNPEYQKEGYDRELFQMIGTEETVSYATHMVGAGVGLGLSALFPEVVFPVSLGALGAWYVGKSLWTCYKHNPDVQFEVNATEHLPTANGIELDNGYTLDFEKVGEEGLEPMEDLLKVNEVASKAKVKVSIDKAEGDWGVHIAPRDGEEHELGHKRKLFDRGFLKHLLGNRTMKEQYNLDNEMFVQRFNKKVDLKTLELEDGTYLFGTEGYLKAYQDREEKA